MGTRGAFGYRIHEVDKVTYNHFDSYPSGLGRDVVSYLQATPVEKMREIADKITLVNGSDKPTPEQIETCRPFANLSVSNQSLEDWYCLLREAQGNLESWEVLPYMLDYQKFLEDSLFCEWAYIINLDMQVLEVYSGFNKDPDAPGRYARLGKDGDYRGVRLIATYSFDEIRKLANLDTWCEEVDAIERKVHT